MNMCHICAHMKHRVHPSANIAQTPLITKSAPQMFEALQTCEDSGPKSDSSIVLEIGEGLVEGGKAQAM